MRKIVIIAAKLVAESDEKCNAELESEIQAEMPIIPYVAKVEKVTVLDCP